MQGKLTINRWRDTYAGFHVRASACFRFFYKMSVEFLIFRLYLGLSFGHACEVILSFVLVEYAFPGDRRCYGKT